MLAIALAAASSCGRTGLDHNDGRRGSGDGGSHDDAYHDDDDDDDGAQTCQEVDFLFVIDNSNSMADNQDKLAAQYDAFIDGFVATVDRLDSIHIGVVTTDEYTHNSAACGGLGGLVVETGGAHSSGRACGPYAEGHNYMTDADDLDEAFRCAADVGTDGSGKEATVTAGIAAISSPMTDSGQCNDGFVRDGALLVLVIVTDEDADLDPLFAISALTEAKGGNENDLVVVALANGPDSGCKIDAHGQIAYGLADLIGLFRYGFLGPICAPDYGAVFTDAVAVIEAACPGR